MIPRSNTATPATDENTDYPYHCPVGEKHCDWLHELADLKRQVEDLSRLVSHDPLTGLFNFRHFSELLPAQLEGTRRSQRPTCLIMVDLDHFKQINDTWGHETGNLALRQAAQAMGSQVRKLDVVCRYGGEEFAIILPDTRLRQAVEVAERIRRCIETTPVEFDDGQFDMTASLGVEVYHSDNPMSPEGFIEAADRLLYEAKEQGRNRVAHRSFAEVESCTSVTSEERNALMDLFSR